MMDATSATPLPTTVATTNGGDNTAEVATGLAGIMVKRVLAFRPTNPLPGITNAKSFAQGLKKEAPKVLDVRGYSKPASVEQALARIKQNVAYFRVTYAAVVGTVVVLFVLSNPTLFIFTVLLLALWTAFLSQPPDHVLQIGSLELKRNEKMVILVSLTVVAVVFGGLISSAFYIVFMSAFLVGAHGALREPIVLDALEQLEKEGESIVQGDVV